MHITTRAKVTLPPVPMSLQTRPKAPAFLEISSQVRQVPPVQHLSVPQSAPASSQPPFTPDTARMQQSVVIAPKISAMRWKTRMVGATAREKA